MGMQQGAPDDFQTPKEALHPLIPYLKKKRGDLGMC